MDERIDAGMRADSSGRSKVAAWLKPVLGALSPAGSRGRLTILMFHHVHPACDPLFPGDMYAGVFRERLEWIRDWFNVLPLEDAVAALRRRTLPARALALTFDDGYADNCTVALPILLEMKLHATFFIASAFLDGGRMWNDTVIETIRRARGGELDLSALGLGRHAIESLEARRRAIQVVLSRLKYLNPVERQARADAVAAQAPTPLPNDLMLTCAQLRDLAAAGMGVGAHTAHHPILAALSDAEARREIVDGREAVAEIVRQPVKLFAYPNGRPNTDYTTAHARLAQALGFVAAVSTAPGAARASTPCYQLPRFTPWDRTPGRYGLRLARNLFTRVQTAAP